MILNVSLVALALAAGLILSDPYAGRTKHACGWALFCLACVLTGFL